MKSSLLLTMCMTLFFHGIKSQDFSTADFVYPKTLVRLHLLVPGILVEQNIKYNSTIILDLEYHINIANLMELVSQNYISTHTYGLNHENILVTTRENY